jgi:hypothetical protein
VVGAQHKRVRTQAIARQPFCVDCGTTHDLCARVIQRSGLKLGHHDREDLLAYLLSTAWQLSVGFDPARTGKNFSGFALYVLRRRVTDWQRSRFRTRWVSKGPRLRTAARRTRQSRRCRQRSTGRGCRPRQHGRW